jgi:hypothetical protein
MSFELGRRQAEVLKAPRNAAAGMIDDDHEA